MLLLEFWLLRVVFLFDLEFVVLLFLMELSIEEVTLLIEDFILLAKLEEDDFLSRRD